MYHCVVTLLGIFTRGFSDCVNVLLPRQLTISQPISLGLVVPNVTQTIMCARAQLKSVTCAETISGLDMIRIHNQYAIGRFGVISASHPLAC